MVPELAQLCWALYAAITAVDILPASATCIPFERAHARIVSDCPEGATFVGFEGRAFACLAVAFLAATRLGFGLFPFAVALLETGFLAAGAFDAAAFVADPGSATVTDVAAPLCAALRGVDLGGEFLAVVFVTVALWEVAFPALTRRLVPFRSLVLPDSVAVLAASGSAGTAPGPRFLRPDVACLAGRFGLMVEALPFVSKASATTARASSNVSWRVSMAIFMVGPASFALGSEAFADRQPTVTLPHRR